MAGRKGLSEARKTEIHRLTIAGQPLLDIAIALDLSKSSVYKMQLALGLRQVNDQRQWLTEDQKDRVRVLTEQGFTCEAIAAALGFHSSTVSRVRSRLELVPERSPKTMVTPEKIKRVLAMKQSFYLRREIAEATGLHIGTIDKIWKKHKNVSI